MMTRELVAVATTTAIATIVTIALIIASGHPTSAGQTMSGDRPQPAKHHFVARRAGKTYPRDPVTTEANLTAAMTDGRLSFLDEIWNPGFVVEPHFHAEHSEAFYIVDGQVEWTVNGETHVMSSGDMVYIPNSASSRRSSGGSAS